MNRIAMMVQPLNIADWRAGKPYVVSVHVTRENQVFPTPDYEGGYDFPLKWIAEEFIEKVRSFHFEFEGMPRDIGEQIYQVYLGYLQEGTPEYDAAVANMQLAPL